jgi:hypothetical protein
MTISVNAQNESRKLLATGLNNISVACIVVGLIGPSVQRLYGLAPVTFIVDATSLLEVVVAWLIAGAAAHMAAQLVVRGVT